MSKSQESLNNNKITIYIASDHAGYEMKQKIIQSKKLDFINFIDLGTNSNESVDYPDYAKKLGDAVLADDKCYGIAICGTGIGISISMNKIKGIYCALVTNKKIAHLARKHNNANVIALSGRFVSAKENVNIIYNFLNEKFEERHQKRIDKIKQLECI